MITFSNANTVEFLLRMTLGSVNYESKFVETNKDIEMFNIKTSPFNDEKYSTFMCSTCNGIVGLNTAKDKRQFLLTENIKIVKEKEIRVGLFSLKEEYCTMFQKSVENLTNLLKDKREISFKFNFKYYKLTKDSQNKKL